MKKAGILLLLAGIFSLFACDNELVITDTKKDIPIVYGFLSRADSVNYIRIERAFLDPDKSALDVAQNPDSLYYMGAEAYLRETSTGQEYSFTMVDGDQLGLIRKEGVFAQSPNYIYQLDLPIGTELTEGGEYSLLLIRPNQTDTVTASTRIVSDLSHSQPFIGNEVLIRYGTRLTVRCKHATDAAILDFFMVFNYLEEDENNPGNYLTKSITFPLRRNVRTPEGGSIGTSIDIFGREVYTAIGNLIPVNTSVNRIFQSIGFRYLAGSQAIVDYLEVVNANSGITGAEANPVYSNISEGFGIFASRTEYTEDGFSLRPESLDSLKNGIYTKELNFK